ncbi:DUF4625 domain-containing protein [Flavobacterium sp. HSC-61S13]|uniref:DUF4625 domain-containing protein n=1 Tax=Flavobacterium sp. HSC-61S13 TaxID=2910963 RepID=UPI00209D5353|nr:DUF4625 domain-containing protein [Flavobacterium sp. HSC-61S13]MCP1996787.1 hypothetical protein [Flavobacterium sp. HSC-61S13]
MKTIKIFSIIALGAFFSLASCSSDDNNVDTVRPNLNLKAPAEGAVLVAGKDVHFDMEVSDNVMLGSYKIDIHNNFDNHNHPSSVSFKEAEPTVDFVFNRVWALDGQKNADIHHHEIIIPANATPGKYHFVVYLLDAAGNETKEARNITIVAPTPPVEEKGHPTVDLVAPTEGAVLVAAKDVHFDMEVSDEEMLESYKVEISARSADHTIVFSKLWSLAGLKEADVHHHEIIIPENATPGDYLFKVIVINKAGNQTVVNRNVTIAKPGTPVDPGHGHDH